VRGGGGKRREGKKRIREKAKGEGENKEGRKAGRE
jgi:hypothetical protein